MPGPFPGMDPYLEHPARWPGLAQRLINGICNAMNDLPPYIADIGERLYVLQPERSIYPDVVLRLRTWPTEETACCHCVTIGGLTSRLKRSLYCGNDP